METNATAINKKEHLKQAEIMLALPKLATRHERPHVLLGAGRGGGLGGKTPASPQPSPA